MFKYATYFLIHDISFSIHNIFFNTDFSTEQLFFYIFFGLNLLCSGSIRFARESAYLACLASAKRVNSEICDTSGLIFGRGKIGLSRLNAKGGNTKRIEKWLKEKLI